MPFDNLTPAFRDALKSRADKRPAKQRAKARATLAADTEAQKNGLPTVKLYLQEAYAVLKHVNDMSRILHTIRRPYLNVDSHHAHLHTVIDRSLDFSSSDVWSNIKHLTNDERDQIDLQARIVFSKCAERVREMERIEQRRAEVVANRGIGILRLLPSRLAPPDALAAQSDYIASHNAGVTWFLNRRLAEASTAQKEMQEERIRRQMERAKTLGSGAAREAALLGLDHPVTGGKQHREQPSGVSTSSAGGMRSWMPGGSTSSSLASSIASLTGTSLSSSIETARPTFASSPLAATSTQYDDDDDVLASGSDGSLELSHSQIQQFESENAAILKSVHDTLASVQKAESSLLDIAALQTELVAHLEQQSQIAEQLFADVIETNEKVDAGNRELIEAKRRQKDSRLYILVFLLGASFALLFLHFY